MLTLVSLALLVAAADDAAVIRAGSWQARCISERRGACVQYEAELNEPVKLILQRSADAILLYVQPSDCEGASRPSSVNPAYSATTMKYMIQGHIVMAMRGCGSELPIPQLDAEELAELLKLTEGVAN